MVASSLRDDLLGIPGVEGAEVDGSPDAPAGLRIRIAEGADQSAVGGAIRRVLSSHGLGTDTRLPGEASQTEPGQVGVLTEDQEYAESTDVEEGRDAVIDLTDKVTAEDAVAETVSEPADERAPEPVDEGQLPEESDTPNPWEAGELPAFVEPRTRPVDTADVEGGSVPDADLSIARIERVAVEEGRGGIIVTVAATDGTEVSEPAASTEGGVEIAVVKAAAKLVDPSMPDPIVIEIDDRRIEGLDVVMIILDADGELVAGSSVVAAGRAFALGRATWAALQL